MSEPESTSQEVLAPRPGEVLGQPNFRKYMIGAFMGYNGLLMETFALGWDLYDRTGEPAKIGMIGLVQVVPVMLLALPAGHIADMFDRRKVLLVAQTLIVLATFSLAMVSWLTPHTVIWPLYVCLLFSAIGRAFAGPTRSALVPLLVPARLLPSAIKWTSGVFQSTVIIGPALAALIIWLANNSSSEFWKSHSAMPVYFLTSALCLGFWISVYLLDVPPAVRTYKAMSISSLLEGLKFVIETRIILASTLLDMFAVLLGGAVALLPVFAKDVLHNGPFNEQAMLGAMKIAPAVGALIMSVAIMRTRMLNRAGRALLWSVAMFGVCTIVFGLSTSFWLSLVMIGLTGAFDMVSVIVRHTLVQTMTPDALRGRVSAVNGLFIGISNELGDVESGFVAQWLTALYLPVLAAPGSQHTQEQIREAVVKASMLTVTAGGVGTILVVIAVMFFAPGLLKLGRLEDMARKD
jgi:MFS family permease